MPSGVYGLCWRIGFACWLAMWLAACDGPKAPPAMNVAEVRQNLEATAHARVFFAHQSVGRNVLQGIEELSTSVGTKVPIRAAGVQSPPGTAGIDHANVGKNREPLGKISAFVEALASGGEPGYDVAVLKFCYEDLSAHGAKDVRTLIDAYTAAVDQLRNRHPRLILIHATVPLRADPPGWKTTLKRLIGRETWEDEGNRMRNSYNSVLRQRFSGQPLFDIAEIESTLPDGSRSAFGGGADMTYTLAAQYTDDGGHLNGAGRQRAAAAFAAAVANALKARNPGS